MLFWKYVWHLAQTSGGKVKSVREIVAERPLDAQAATFVASSRKAALACLRGEDRRLLLIVGPCSLHDPEANLEYGLRLSRLAARIGARPGDRNPGQSCGGLLIVMRAYPEKSRTALGFRGLAEEPWLDGRRDPEQGVERTRDLLVALARLGLPLAAELVSPHLHAYWEDCLSWGAVGARGVEAQYLRELAAALPFPCGFKNDRSGDPGSALDACVVASKPTRLLGLDTEGRAAVLEAAGNPLPHVVLRGAGGGAMPPARNFDKGPACLESMALLGLRPALVLDAAHGNAAPSGQAESAREAFAIALEDRKAGRGNIAGVMLESNLEPGCQRPGPLVELLRGQSVTDPCLGWDETESLIVEAAEAFAPGA